MSRRENNLRRMKAAKRKRGKMRTEPAGSAAEKEQDRTPTRWSHQTSACREQTMAGPRFQQEHRSTDLDRAETNEGRITKKELVEINACR